MFEFLISLKVVLMLVERFGVIERLEGYGYRSPVASMTGYEFYQNVILLRSPSYLDV